MPYVQRRDRVQTRRRCLAAADRGFPSLHPSRDSQWAASPHPRGNHLTFSFSAHTLQRSGSTWGFAGFSIHRDNHFAAIVIVAHEYFLYDGLASPPLKRLNSLEQIEGWRAGIIYYYRIHWFACFKTGYNYRVSKPFYNYSFPTCTSTVNITFCSENVKNIEEKLSTLIYF